MARFEPCEDPLNSSCLLPPSYFDVPEPEPEPQRLTADHTSPAVTEAINAAISQQFESMARLSRQLERDQEELAERKAEVKALQQKVTDTEAAAAKRLASVSADYERKISVNEGLARDALKRLEDERDEMIRRSNEQEASLVRQLEQMRVSLESSQSTNNELIFKLNETAANLDNAQQEVEKLRTFQRWEKDRWQMLDRCMQLEASVKASASAADLKQQRLDALQSILTLQESELVRHGCGAELETLQELLQALQGLTGRWRQKVFSLMVQIQALRQDAEYEAQRSEAEMVESSRELERSRGVVAQLELKLSAAQAELCEERALLEQTARKLHDAETAADEAVKDRDAWREAVVGLRTSVDMAMTTFGGIDHQLTLCARIPLVNFDRRIQALSERLPVLKAQLKRLRSRDAVEQARAEFDSREAELRRELDVVREDRDRLASHVERDAEERAANEGDLRRQYEAQIVALERNCETARLELLVKSEALERLQEEHSVLVATCESAEKDRQRLAAEVAALEASRDSAVTAATAGLFEEHARQMGELHTALEEARREHAKAILSLRQAERELNRCRAERAAEAAELEEKARQRELDLEAELSRAAAEANLLRATVRQEGLLRIRGASRPVPREEEEEEVQVQQTEMEGAIKAHSSPRKAPEQFQPHLVNLIEEVRSLVRSVETSDLYGTDDDDDVD